MKTTFLLVLAIAFSVLQAEAGITTASTTVNGLTVSTDASVGADTWGRSKRKKNKYKKRRNGNKNRRRHGLFGR